METTDETVTSRRRAEFWSGDQNINSTTFGVIGSMFYPQRVMQFGVHYKF